MLGEDYNEVFALWQSCEGIGLSNSDSPEAIAAFLLRNPGMNAVARAPDGRLVGAVLCGDDGRRGIAAELLRHCFAALAARRISKCNVFVFLENADGADFWEHAGWTARGDLSVLQKRLK
jgi:putative acetyltransferase